MEYPVLRDALVSLLMMFDILVVSSSRISISEDILKVQESESLHVDRESVFSSSQESIQQAWLSAS